MKYLIAFILFFAQYASAQTIWSGNDIKAMKYNVDLFGRSKLMGLNVNPTAASGVAAPLGSIGMDYLTGNAYIKTTSSATGWTSIATGGSLSSYVPYSGATTNVDLGSNNLSTTGFVQANIVSLPATTSGGDGIVYKNGKRFIHSYTNTNGGQGDNIFIGSLAGNLTLSASYGDNIGIGDGALGSLTSGYAHGAFGYKALNAMQSGNYSTAIGDQSLYLSTSAAPNTAVGAHSMAAAVGADYNTCVGYACLLSNVSGQANVCVGDSCMNDYASAANTGFNACAGFSCLRNLTTGVQNAAVGAWTGSQTTQLNGGSYNTLLGYATGPGVGFEAMNYSTALGYLTKVSRSNATNIGSQSGHRVGILRSSPESTLDIGGDLNLLGISSAPSLSSGASGKIYFDSVANKFYASENGGAFVSFVPNPNYLSFPTTSTSSIGVILQNGTAVWNSYGTANLFLGKNAGNFTTTATNSVCVGEGSCGALTTGIINVALGYQANQSVQDGADNIAIGYRALNSNVSASHLIGIGNQALGINTGASNLAIGYGALSQNVGGTFNAAVGENALFSNASGLANTSMGHYSNYSGTSDGNSSFGFGALRGITSGSGHNTGIGRDAGYNTTALTTGSYSSFFGANSHPFSSAITYGTAIGAGSIVGRDYAVVVGPSDSRARLGIGIISNPTSTIDIPGDVNLLGMSAPTLASGSNAKLYYSSSTNQILASVSGAAFAPLYPVSGAAFPTQVSGAVFAGPGTGSNASPDFRRLVLSDLPAIISSLGPVPQNGYIPIGNGTSYTLAGITAISGITITSGAGSISITDKNAGTGARYYSTATPSIASGAYATVDFETKDYDECSPACVTTGSGWKYTVPTTGKYQFNVQTWINSAVWTAAAGISLLRLYKNGTTVIIEGPVYIPFNVTTHVTLTLRAELSLTAGDTISPQMYCSRQGGACVLITNSYRNFIEIRRVGD